MSLAQAAIVSKERESRDPDLRLLLSTRPGMLIGIAPRARLLCF
jgi:hypothetical protein